MMQKSFQSRRKSCHRCGKEESTLAIVETHYGKAQWSDGGSNILPFPNETDSILFQATEKKGKRGRQNSKS